jgi:DNA-directed RNA polymerase specialized sigma24 family protein
MRTNLNFASAQKGGYTMTLRQSYEGLAAPGQDSAKQRLRHYRGLEEELNHLLSDKARIIAEIAPGTIHPERARPANKDAQPSDMTGRIAVGLAAIDENIDAAIAKIGEERGVFENLIAPLSSEKRRLARLRYVNCLSWDDVAEALGYGVRQLHRLHGELLCELDNRLGTK